MRIMSSVAIAVLVSLALPLEAQRTPAPTGLSVTGTAASALVSWQPVTGAVSYSVKRWKQDDLKCCNNAVRGLGKEAWTDLGAADEGFALPGIYVFEVTVLLDTGMTGSSVVNWTRTEDAVVSRTTLTTKTIQPMNLAAPTGLTVRNDPSALVLSWQAVTGATGYQIDVAPALAGPWSPLSPAPVAATQFVHNTPVTGALMYYRVSGAISFAVAGGGTIVPFIYNPPLNPPGVSAVQSGGNVTVSWIPVPGASGYKVTASLLTGSGVAPIQIGWRATSATFMGMVPPGLPNGSYSVALFHVTAQFPPSGISGVYPANGVGLVFDPALCWSPAGEQPGGPGVVIAPPISTSATVKLSWPLSGQVYAYRVERAPAGSALWEALACLRPLTALDPNKDGRISSSSTTEFQDRSVALQPATTYQYRVTAIGSPDATGKRVTNTSLVTATTTPIPSVVVGVVASAPGALTPWVRLSWPAPAEEFARVGYLVTSSYGFRGPPSTKTPTSLDIVNVPRGTHTFTVTPVYVHGVRAQTTTVSVVVP